MYRPSSLFVIILLSIYLILSVWLLCPPKHTEHTSLATSDCPFMPNEQTMCPMDTLDHLQAWKNIYSTPLSTLFVLIGIALVLWQYSQIQQQDSEVRIRDRLRHRLKHKIPTPFTLLFACGILHPKIPEYAK